MSDTHTQGASRGLPPTAWPYVETADHILHAGDVCDPALLQELQAFAPVTAVLGNCDGHALLDWGAQETAEIELGRVPIALVHDSGPASGRRDRMRKRWPSARVVIFGHSHLPVNDDDGDLLLFNPGSPTWPRRAPWPSMGLLWIESGKLEAEIFPV